MTGRERADLDRHITGNYGEDQFENLGASAAPESPPTGLEALITAMEDAKAGREVKIEDWSDDELLRMLDITVTFLEQEELPKCAAHVREAARRLRSHEDSVMQAWYAGFDFANETRKEE